MKQILIISILLTLMNVSVKALSLGLQIENASLKPVTLVLSDVDGSQTSKLLPGALADPLIYNDISLFKDVHIYTQHGAYSLMNSRNQLLNLIKFSPIQDFTGKWIEREQLIDAIGGYACRCHLEVVIIIKDNGVAMLQPI